MKSSLFISVSRIEGLRMIWQKITRVFEMAFAKRTFTFAQNKILAYDEPAFRDYPALSRVGKPLGLHLGYVSQGLFPDQATIDKSPSQNLGYVPMPGDIWYVDQPNFNGEYH